MSRSKFLYTRSLLTLCVGVVVLGTSGCADTPQLSASGQQLHRDKDIQGVWLASGFDFTGYDSIYIAPPNATAAPHNDEEAQLLPWAKSHLQSELAAALQEKRVFPKVVTDERAASGHALKFVSTIVEYEKGGGAARYFVGVYGGGQPKIKINASALDGTIAKGEFVIERSGEGAGARLGGAFMSDKDIQSGDIRDLAADFAEFVQATAKHLPREP